MPEICITEIGPLQPAELHAAYEIAASAPDPWREGDLAAALADGNRICLAARSTAGNAPHSTAGCGTGRSIANKAIEGFICLRVLGDEAELEMMAVAPTARRRGVGRALITAGLAACKKHGATRCLLELRRGNTAALALYQSFGFATLALRPAMYAAPREDGLCMELTL